MLWRAVEELEQTYFDSYLGTLSTNLFQICERILQTTRTAIPTLVGAGYATPGPTDLFRTLRQWFQVAFTAQKLPGRLLQRLFAVLSNAQNYFATSLLTATRRALEFRTFPVPPHPAIPAPPAAQARPALASPAAREAGDGTVELGESEGERTPWPTAWAYLDSFSTAVPLSWFVALLNGEVLCAGFREQLLLRVEDALLAWRREDENRRRVQAATTAIEDEFKKSRAFPLLLCTVESWNPARFVAPSHHLPPPP